MLLAGRRPLAGEAQEAFRRLCAWGRISGVPRKKSETPDEYIRRLAARFPSLEQTLVIFARKLEKELYGKRILAAAEIEQLKAASVSLMNPALIPGRIAGRLGIVKRHYLFK